MSWGTKILITYLLFVCGIGYLVYRSAREKIDLVTPDYYAKELKFQDKIDEHGNVARLSAPVQVSVANDSLMLLFPAEFLGKDLKGKLVFFYPADKDKDFTVAIETMSGTFSTKLPAGIYGQHQLQVSWAVEGTNYYIEKKIFFQ